MRNAFLVSDEDLKSLRSGEPWSIELQGQAVFMHESVLRLLQQRQQPQELTSTNTRPTSGPYFCDIPTCDKSKPDKNFHGFQTYGNMRSHQYAAHRMKAIAPPSRALPPPGNGHAEKLAGYLGAKSYNYKEFDAKGICGVGDCDYKDKRIRSLHFHRSVKHEVRGINWARNYHKSKYRTAKHKGPGRPRKEA